MKRWQAAYEQAHYRVMAEPAFTLHINQPSPELLQLYAKRGIRSAAFITAHNPRSVTLPDTENAQRQQQLETQLAQINLPWLPGAGEDPAGAWPAEQSCLILGIDRQTAHKLAQTWQQNAVVYCDLDAVPVLLWTGEGEN